MVATSVLYLALDAMGVFETVNTSLGDLIDKVTPTEPDPRTGRHLRHAVPGGPAARTPKARGS